MDVGCGRPHGDQMSPVDDGDSACSTAEAPRSYETNVPDGQLKLLRITRAQGTHMRWEQPRKSFMFRTPLMRELFSYTQESHFDMCNVGNLKCPETGHRIQTAGSADHVKRRVLNALRGRTGRRE